MLINKELFEGKFTVFKIKARCVVNIQVVIYKNRFGVGRIFNNLRSFFKS